MTLAELLKALNAAKAALEADPENEELKTKVDEAQAAYDAKKQEDDQEDEDEGDLDDSKWDEKTAAYIKKLRKEAADNRAKKKDLASQLKVSEEQKRAILKAAGIETEESDPTETLKKTTQANETLALRNAILEKAVAYGVGNDKLKYFQFLVMDAMENLEEGEELDEEALETLAKQCRSKGMGNTSVNGKGGKGGNPNPDDDKNKEVTVGKFITMNMGQKEELYRSNPDLYKRLTSEARRTGKLI
jgi:hypothetical protein